MRNVELEYPLSATHHRNRFLASGNGRQHGFVVRYHLAELLVGEKLKFDDEGEGQRWARAPEAFWC